MGALEKHSYHGIVNVDIERPGSDIIERFKKLSVCLVSDAQGLAGVMDSGIKPIDPSMRFCGSAVTVMTKPCDGLFVKKAMDVVKPGDVLVIDGGGVETCSLTGERIAEMFQLLGAVAIVIDGACRDSQGIIDLGMPVFSRGTVIRHIGNAMGPGAVNVPIQCGRTIVNPGDIVMGDRDGIVVVPREDAERIVKAAEDHLDGELERINRVKAGEPAGKVWNFDTGVSRWQG